MIATRPTAEPKRAPMHNSYSQLPSVLLLTFFIAVFTTLYRRTRRESVRWWVAGWTFILAHFAVQFVPLPANTRAVGTVLSLVALVIGAAAFVVAGSKVLRIPARRRMLFVITAGPPAVYASAYALEVRYVPLYAATMILGYLSGVWFTLRQNRETPLLAGASALALGVLGSYGLYATLEGQFGLGVYTALTTLFLYAGANFMRSYQRLTLGAVTTTLGFISAGMVFPAAVLTDAAHWQVNPDIWNVPKLVIALGMMLTLTEDESIELNASRRELMRSEQRFSLIASATSDVLWDWDLPTGKVWRNAQFSRVFRCPNGLEHEEWLARLHPEDRPRVVRSIETALAAHQSHWVEEYRFRCGDGAWRIVEDRGAFVYRKDGTPLRGLGGMRDITQYRETEEKCRSIVDNAVQGIFQSTPDGHLISANRSLAALLDFDSPEELIRARTDLLVSSYVHPKQRDAFLAEMRRHGSVKNFEYCIRKKDGTPIWVSETSRAVYGRPGEILFFEGTIQDITDRRRLEQQLRQAQRLEAIGRLSGGVAHDFNNLLMIITSYSEMIARSMPPTHPVRLKIDRIMHAAERASDLTRQLLAFARQQVLTPRALDLNEVIRDMRELISRLLSEDIVIVMNPAPHLSAVRADRGQIEQVLLNLAANARDAMPGGGTLTIATKAVDRLPDFPDLHTHARDSGWVKLSVSDTGQGMSSDVQARIFEPFFTTKDVGKGTGLGLATVYGIVKQSGGYINVESQVGSGSTFDVYLPICDSAMEAVEAPDGCAVLTRGNETVLLVEDQAELREVTMAYLSDRGYSVLPAASGAEALAIADTHPSDVHVLLTDVVMPGMSGYDLAARVIEKYPRAAVIYMSGYSEGGHTAGPPGTFVQKPAPLELLVSKIAAASQPVAAG